MDMNKSYVLKKEDHKPKWLVIDASGKVLGRLSTEIANVLRGKNKANYTPHTDSGDYVVVINCNKVRLTGNKLRNKFYYRYSGYRSGLKKSSALEIFEKDPTFLIRQAVKGMLPKNRLNRKIIKKLKVYSGGNHPHLAQIKSVSS